MNNKELLKNSHKLNKKLKKYNGFIREKKDIYKYKESDGKLKKFRESSIHKYIFFISFFSIVPIFLHIFLKSYDGFYLIDGLFLFWGIVCLLFVTMHFINLSELKWNVKISKTIINRHSDIKLNTVSDAINYIKNKSKSKNIIEMEIDENKIKIMKGVVLKDLVSNSDELEPAEFKHLNDLFNEYVSGRESLKNKMKSVLEDGIIKAKKEIEINEVFKIENT